MVVQITKCYYGYQLTEHMMGGACGTYGGEEKLVQDFGWET